MSAGRQQRRSGGLSDTSVFAERRPLLDVFHNIHPHVRLHLIVVWIHGRGDCSVITSFTSVSEFIGLSVLYLPALFMRTFTYLLKKFFYLLDYWLCPCCVHCPLDFCIYPCCKCSVVVWPKVYAPPKLTETFWNIHQTLNCAVFYLLELSLKVNTNLICFLLCVWVQTTPQKTKLKLILPPNT